MPVKLKPKMIYSRMQPEPIERLIERIAVERERFGSILDIPAEEFFRPPFTSSRFSVLSDSCALPVGPAAGPHTHLAQSILAGWLCGGRVFELKTVQILDELEIEKPCIDAADEGYNTEWSSELRLDEAAEEYIKAWILLHIVSSSEYGTPDHGALFTMSVGYDLEGIRSKPVDRFIDTLMGRGSRSVFERLREAARGALERATAGGGLRAAASTDVLDAISPAICSSVALSTMHGCPPEEIEAIAVHLLENKGLDTVVKLNPTLLGVEEVRGILAKNGYEYGLDADAFAEDLQYPRALTLIEHLRHRASAAGHRFGIKLSNTLPVANDRGSLPGETEYVSGKALLPITVSLAARLLSDVEGPLPVSYSAGATAGNIGELLGCGLAPVTISTELLKPGGYQRLAAAARAASDALSAPAPGAQTPATQLQPDPGRLSDLATALLGRHDVRKRRGAVTARIQARLPVTDCFVAPCVEACPISQDVPGYIRAAATGAPEEALHCILETNPFPSLTAALCDQRCAKACNRIEYEGSVQIRKMKGIAVRRAGGGASPSAVPGDWAPPGGEPSRGSGPSVVVREPGIEGMSAAYFHARAGRDVRVSESLESVAARIESELEGYRIPEGAINADLEGIAAAGVRFAASAPAAAAEIVVRQDAPPPRPRIVEIIAAGKRRVEEGVSALGPGDRFGEAASARDSRRGAAAADRGHEIRRKAGRHIGPGRGTDNEVAEIEFSRCLECDTVCLKCVQVCPNRANTAVEVPPEDGFRDRYQVVHIDDWCNDCGNCATFCPYGARPYREKLTVFSSLAALRASPAPGFFVNGEEIHLRPAFEGEVRRVTRRDLEAGPRDGGGGPDGTPGGVGRLIGRILTDYAYLLPGGS
jgi:putative selenate reductase